MVTDILMDCSVCGWSNIISVN